MSVRKNVFCLNSSQGKNSAYEQRLRAINHRSVTSVHFEPPLPLQKLRRRRPSPLHLLTTPARRSISQVQVAARRTANEKAHTHHTEPNRNCRADASGQRTSACKEGSGACRVPAPGPSS